MKIARRPTLRLWADIRGVLTRSKATASVRHTNRSPVCADGLIDGYGIIVHSAARCGTALRLSHSSKTHSLLRSQ
jgi:hypothetical protein